MKCFYIAFIYFFSVGTSFAAPPPPAILPSNFPKEIEGYNVGDIYSTFVQNIEYAYPQILIGRAKSIEINNPHITNGPHIIFHADWRRNSELYQFSRDCQNDCQWELHILEIDTQYFDEVAIEEFNLKKIIDNLKHANIPSDDIRSYKESFVTSSIEKKISENIEIETLTETQCPTILESLEVLEGLKLPRIDIENVGKDRKGENIVVHTTWVEIEIPQVERKSVHKGQFQISGYGPHSYAGQISKKVFKSLETCFNN